MIRRERRRPEAAPRDAAARRDVPRRRARLDAGRVRPPDGRSRSRSALPALRRARRRELARGRSRSSCSAASRSRGSGFGAASLIRSAEGASAVVNLIFLPMAFLSGSFGPTHELPRGPPEDRGRPAADVPDRPDRGRVPPRRVLVGRPEAVAVLVAWGVAGYVVAASASAGSRASADRDLRGAPRGARGRRRRPEPGVRRRLRARPPREPTSASTGRTARTSSSTRPRPTRSRAVLALADGHGIPVTPFGVGTSLEGHVIPVEGGHQPRPDAHGPDPRRSRPAEPDGDRAGRRTRDRARARGRRARPLLPGRPGSRRDARRHGGDERRRDDDGALREDARERARARGGARGRARRSAPGAARRRRRPATTSRACSSARRERSA